MLDRELPALFDCRCCEQVVPELVALRHRQAGHELERLPEGAVAELQELWGDRERDPITDRAPRPTRRLRSGHRG